METTDKDNPNGVYKLNSEPCNITYNRRNWYEILNKIYRKQNIIKTER